MVFFFLLDVRCDGVMCESVWVLGVSSDFETCVSFDKLGLAKLELTLYNIRGQKS